ncbi:tetratricopeptide repeat protein [Actinoplanes sp. NPDC048967]|uniref:tetratricopeptide repeat protein n=1 Tax=Actinoplanes sp. NPDC048967 TaxID=3155269 RepID=UPI0033D73652
MRRLSARVIITVVVVCLGMAVAVGFLARQKLADADQYSSVGSGLVALFGFLVVAGGGVATVIRFVTQRARVDDRPGLVGDVGDLDLGVAVAIHSPHAISGVIPLYIGRSIDDELREAVKRGGFVLVHGEGPAGKTRTAVVAINNARRGQPLWRPAGPDELRKLAEAPVPRHGAVVWLDRLERFLGPDGLDLATLDRLTRDQRLAVVATIRDEQIAAIRSAPAAGAPPGTDVLSGMPGHRWFKIDRFLTPEEWAAAPDDTRYDPRLEQAYHAREGFGEYLVAGRALLDRWLVGGGPLYAVGSALVSAAVDCARAGLRGPVPVEVLEKLLPRYLADPWYGRTDLPTVADGLAWATTRVLGASSCLWPVPGGYLASEQLVGPVRALSRRPGPPVQDAVWPLVYELAAGDDGELRSIAANAVQEERTDWAERIARPMAEAGDAEAAAFLACLLVMEKRWDDAIEWGRRSAQAGSTRGMIIYGMALGTRFGELEAEVWLQAAAERGDLSGAFVLGEIAMNRGDRAAAKSWWRRGAEAGELDAKFALALLMEDDDDPAYARLLGELVMADHPEALTEFGARALRAGEVTMAAGVLMRAADRGSVTALYHLGVHAMLTEGDGDRAILCWREAAERGHVPAMTGLSLLLTAADPAESDVWLRKAAELGEPQAVELLNERRQR